MEESKILQIVEAIQKNVNGLILSVGGIQQELTSFKKEVREEFAEVKERISELKATADTTDKILEHHPVN